MASQRADRSKFSRQACAALGVKNARVAVGDHRCGPGVEIRYTGVMFKVEVEQETDGRWIAEVPELPGVITYGASREEAVTRAQALSLRVLAERLEHGEDLPQ